MINDQGNLKLADFSLLNIDSIPYLKALSGEEVGFLSPILMNSLKNRILIPKHDCYKSVLIFYFLLIILNYIKDVFSVGMTILCAASLCNGSEFYNFNIFNIKTVEIQNKIKLVFMKYSDYLGNILMEILQQDEAYRPDFQELQGIINDYLDNNEKEKIETIITNPVIIKKQVNF